MSRTTLAPRFRRRWQQRELVLLGLLFLTPFLAYWFISLIVAIEAAFLAAGGFFVIVLLRGNWSLFGPHFYYDIIRLARRGRSTNVRIVYLTALLVCLGLVYRDYLGRHGDFFDTLFEPGIGVSYNAMARLAETYVGTILILQNLAVLLLTPAYVATALTEERERRTLELLFASQLRDREIVLGKLMARLVHMGGVLLCGLPILSLAQFFGGIDMFVLLANFAITALNLWTVGVVCIMTSALSKTALSAVLASYATLIPFALCFSCLTVVFTNSTVLMVSQRDFGGSYVHLLEIVGALLVVHGLISGVCLSVAINNVRSQPDLDFEATVESLRLPPRGDTREVPIEERILNRDQRRGVRKITGDPLLWKEVHTGGPLLSAIFWLPIASLMFPLVVAFLFAVFHVARAEEDVQAIRGLATFFIIGLASMYCLGVAFRGCVSVARERQQGTLDGLLTLPVTLHDVLTAKWQGSLIKGWVWGVLYVCVLFMAVISGGFDLLPALLLIVVPPVHAVFLASLGLFLSVASRGVLAAQVRLALIVVLILVLTSLGFSGVFGGGAGEWADFCLCLNPPVCWHMLCQGPPAFARMFPMEINHWLGMMGLSLIVYAIAAFVFWLLACHLFTLERFRTRE